MPVTPPEKRREPRLTAEMLARAASPLVELDWRLLHWLLRYPLQRADDLVVGVARWASRATVYRHLQALEASRVVESVLPKTPGEGKRLYYLSNLGLHVLAMHQGIPARELASEWQVDETGLLCRLPRLPTLLLLQDVVNGLITGAAESMTRQGRRPELIRWTWQRDVAHRFQYREQAMRLFVDGAVGFCVRARQSDGTTLDLWYGLLLLCTELDDERLMHLRLERLLCWRESPERWSSYQHMLPVLILANSPRQGEHWQHAVETSALKLHLDPLQGALSCLPDPACTHENPWRLAWRTLSTNQSSHLADLLRAVPPAVFTPFLEVGKDEEETRRAGVLPPATASSGSSERPTRLVVGDLACRAATLTSNHLEEQEVIALLGLRLTACHWHIVRLLLAHPLLSDEELAQLLDMERTSVRSSLYTLHALGCLEPITTLAGRRWRLRERGLQLIAVANHLSLRNLVVRRDADAHSSPIVQRGVRWLLEHIQHTAGIYGFFAALTRAARPHPGQRLCWWETGAVCERHYRVGDQWHNLWPDALAEFQAGSQQFRFWLEWDRGTMNVRDLAVKFDAYSTYISSHEWARERSSLPKLLCVAPAIAQERRMHRVAQARLAQTPGSVVWTTTEVLLKANGPVAPIWMQVKSQSNQLKASGVRRCEVFNGNAGEAGREEAAYQHR